MLVDRAAETERLRHRLLCAQQRMKKQADKHRNERVFAVGDQVYLKVQPYLQHSLAYRYNQKLSLKFYGPYEVLHRVGKVSYQLALPAGSRIHGVIHVYQLKKQVLPSRVVPFDSQDSCLLTLNSSSNRYSAVCVHPVWWESKTSTQGVIGKFFCNT